MVWWLAIGLTVRFEPQREGRDYLFLLPVWTCAEAYWAMFTVWYDTLSWEYSSQGMELITHPNLVLMLKTSRAVPLLLLCATIGMLSSDLYFLHTFGWLFMNTVFMYRQKRRAANNKSVKSKEFIKKVCFFLPKLEVTWHTVAIIIWVVLLSLYLRICGVSLSSIRGWKGRVES